MSKLKRDRLGRGAGGQQSLGDDSHAVEASTIIVKKPDVLSPALRIFRRASAKSAQRMLARYGIFDLEDLKTALCESGIDGLADSIICGDSVAVLSCMPVESVRCIITSPPYWNVVDYGVRGQYGQTSYGDYLEQLLAVWRECHRILVPNGKLCINVPLMPIAKSVISSQHTRHLKNLSNDIEHSILSKIEGFKLFSLYIWQKQTTEKMFGSYPHPPNLYEQNTIEFINVFVKDGKPQILPKGVKEASKLSESEWMNLTKQVWRLYPEDVKRTQHPAPFPVSLPSRLIAMYTFGSASRVIPPFPGDIVLDPFVGTGSTCIAARELGRRFIGIDLVPEFCVTAARRIEQTLTTRRIRLDEYGNGRLDSATRPTDNTPLGSS